MKTRSTLLLVAFMSILAFFLGRELVKNKVPEGMVLVEQATVDSLKAYIALADSLETLANLPPDTISVTDTIYIDTTKQVTTSPVPVVIANTDTLVYEDSLKVEEEIDVSIKFKTTSPLASPIEWKYSPIKQKFEVVIEKPVPYPVIETVEVEKFTVQTGHYISGAIGGNENLFIFGLDYDIVRKDYIYGIQYRRMGQANVYGVKVGINITQLYNKIFKNGPNRITKLSGTE